jgi:hypothetical protein
MRDAARAAEMAEGEVALEKLKDLAGKEAARRAATGQAGKDKRVSEEAARRAATGQAGKDKRAAHPRRAIARRTTTPRTHEAQSRAAQSRSATARRVNCAALFAPRYSRRAIRAALFAPRNRAYMPRQFCNAHPVVPFLLTPP